jgi:putative component of membrane protein insertase Oxa1/YidC/SpoIIIJ protein YidD
MKQFLVFAIHFYRTAIKPFYKRTCLFRVSCSMEVLNETRLHGFRGGMNALSIRLKYCRPGFQWAKNPETGKHRLIFPDGKYLEENEISAEVLTDNRF